MTAAHRRRLALLSVVIGLWLAAAAWKAIGRPLLGASLSAWLRVLSNSFPSLIGGLTVPLGFLAARPDPLSSDVPRACLWAGPLLVLAEVVELAFKTSHFDWYDVGLSLLGVLLTGAVAIRTLPRRPSVAADSIPRAV